MIHTESNVSNVVSLSNNVNIQVGRYGELDCRDGNGNGGLSIIQKNLANAKIVTQIDNQTAVNLKAELQNDLRSSASQSNALIQGFLANIGQSTNQNLKQSLHTRIESILENNVNVQTINAILNQVRVVNNATLVVDGKLGADFCTINQENSVDFQSSAIISNIINTVSSDSIVNRAVAEATQANTVKQAGIEAAIKAIGDAVTGPFLIWALLTLGLVAIGGGGVIYAGTKAITSPPFLIFALVLVVLALVISYFTKRWPFNKKKAPTFWMCAQENGMNLGHCLEIDEIKRNLLPANVQVFNSEGRCMDNKCPMYWGCSKGGDGFYTGQSKQCISLQDGENACPASSQEEALRTCGKFVNVCARTPAVIQDGKIHTPETAVCVRYNPDKINAVSQAYTGASPDDAKQKCTSECSV
jgi:hypothetical protein